MRRLALVALSLALPRAAEARCTVRRMPTEEGVDIVVQVQAEPVGCRTVTLTSGEPFALKAWHLPEGGGRERLRKDHLRPVPGGGWEVGAPELRVGDRLVLAVTSEGDDLTVALAPAAAVAAAHPTGVRVEERRDVLLDPKHPEWGFADPSLARTDVELRLDGPLPAGWVLPLPTDAAVADAGGLLPVPLGLRAPAALDGPRTVRWKAPGAEPQGVRHLPPGTLTLASAGVEWVTTAGPGVTVEAVDGGVRFVAPEGGEARWRVARVGGRAVIPDAATYVAGLTWRFARESLPEPAVPVRLKSEDDRDALLRSLWTEVRALTPGALPGAEALRPRHLNRAWRSGWATPVERALILHRFLGQEKFPATWALTGAQADPATLTGYDAMLIRISDEDAPIWLDPACRACAFGEISTRWMGRPALGAVDEVPRQPGRLERVLTLVGTRFTARVTATGAAALWLREQIVDLEPERRAARLAEALGLPGGVLVTATGLDQPGHDVTVTIEGDRVPTPPFEGEPPWRGGWADVLPMDPTPGTD